MPEQGIGRRLRRLARRIVHPSRDLDKSGQGATAWSKASSESAATFCMPQFVPGQTDIRDWIQTGIRGFKEWYQPVDFSNGIVAHVTVPPDWEPKPELDKTRGMAKWEHIIRSHIPDLTEKRVLDLGCNNGLFSLQMARLGAEEVIGVDRSASIAQRSNPNLPHQNVVSQAEFVKQAFEVLEGKHYPVSFVALDFAHVSEARLGRFDFILALCVVYHQLAGTPALLGALAEMTDHLVLQSYAGHQGELGRWADPFLQAKILHELGFTEIHIDAPVGYGWPVLVAKR